MATTAPTAASARPPPPRLRHAAAMWTDNANITRTRVVPAARLADPRFRVTLTNAVQGRAAMGDAPFESPVGEVYLVPDLPTTAATNASTHASAAETTRSPELHDVSRWMDGAGAFFGDMALDGGARTWRHCPRSFLGAQLARLRADARVGPTVGFELEFQLLRAGSLEPIDSALYCSMKAFHDGAAWRVLRTIVECLEDELRIPVHQYHAESASGQLEISIGPFGVDEASTEISEHDKDAAAVRAIVHAVDKLVLARQTVYAVAAQAGFHATFVPKLRPGEAGNAAHVHIGLVDLDHHSASSTNLFATDVARAKSFLAGVLDELPGMCMLLAPTVNSYNRLQPKCWAGAYQCYGYENREAPLRLVGPTTAREDMRETDHFEVKTLDGTANPYLALGAILAAGMSGMDRALALPPPCGQDPATLPKAERPNLLPRSLPDAIAEFRARMAFWSGVLSISYAELLLTLRSAELAHYGAIADDEERVRQLVKRY